MADIELRNYTEEAVRLYVNRWLPDTDMCHCEICKHDVMAIMLNRLPQKYVVTDKGSLFAQLDDFDPQHRVNFMTEMTRAIKIVERDPRH